jgi:hypothetical protein
MESIMRGFRVLRLGLRQARQLARIAEQQRRYGGVRSGNSVAPTNILLERTNQIEERVRQLA